MSKQLPTSTREGGRDYLRDYAEFCAGFPDDSAGLDHLGWLRWPDGFVPALSRDW